ncbi:hypothetical protein LX36DRAFT_734733 [Colletotrichum falcatum]|nr:hypothetical protein LX36DRAFT_734733 [Colletotrichum falcatum]
MKEGENKEEINVNIKIPSKILRDVLNDSKKQKAEDSVDYRGCKVHALSHGRLRDTGGTSFVRDSREVKGNRIDRLKEYCD